MIKAVSLGLALNEKPLVDLRQFWKKMTIVNAQHFQPNYSQRALLTRARVLMLEGQERYFSFLLSLCKQQKTDNPLNQELIHLLEQAPLQERLEDKLFIQHFNFIW
ncbi:hypothetical protein RND59_19020 [Vibrio ruber]|uniref:hypothetical protein n=1 Tax=Vibrio ruber TaxID=184755 RepID=UPI0028936458|nr:hypothetical protein [Vibrio ruber]WNJ97297.1 hypothetical protein RND59_19020 [Vibrio ruber]